MRRLILIIYAIAEELTIIGAAMLAVAFLLSGCCAPQGSATGAARCGTVVDLSPELEAQMADESARLGAADPLAISNMLFGNMRDEARGCQAALATGRTPRP